MLRYLTHKLKTQSIDEENTNGKVSKIFRKNLFGKNHFDKNGKFPKKKSFQQSESE
jgi:hypothetical protein